MVAIDFFPLILLPGSEECTREDHSVPVEHLLLFPSKRCVLWDEERVSQGGLGVDMALLLGQKKPFIHQGGKCLLSPYSYIFEPQHTLNFSPSNLYPL